MATLVEGDSKASFMIATTPRCRGSAAPFPGLLLFTFDPYRIILSVKQGGIKYHFLSLSYDSTWDWTSSPGPLANTLLIRPTTRLMWIHKFTFKSPKLPYGDQLTIPSTPPIHPQNKGKRVKKWKDRKLTF